MAQPKPVPPSLLPLACQTTLRDAMGDRFGETAPQRSPTLRMSAMGRLRQVLPPCMCNRERRLRSQSGLEAGMERAISPSYEPGEVRPNVCRIQVSASTGAMRTLPNTFRVGRPSLIQRSTVFSQVAHFAAKSFFFSRRSL